ncbi:D-alanyl-D-alanine carboxypeptidase family protein [Clostridium sp. D53t1_180928_C8]|uniref:D-alanyl-D-alanine carboxypeptidase family protein n=1 Tax=Clostridium sp. D53t1_180928_C8 TaxID=2787101 RepID=UPI0018A8B642|nr:D-alanyl-D-alanine carboxypeptidase family protein [Clostridium sp. D53t1_180928_C8]
MNKKLIGNIILVFFISIVMYILMVSRPKNIVIKVDGKIIEHKSTGKNVKEIIDEANIKLNREDKINYSLEDKIINNQEIVINRIYSIDEEVIEEIDFKEVIVKDYKTVSGESKVISEGIKGENKKSYIVTYEDGKEIDRILKAEEIIKEPTDKVVSEGIFEENSLTVCVNKNRKISSDYEPQDLILPNVRAMNSESSLYMRKEAALALENLFNAAEEQGLYLYATSGYRSYSTQKSIYNPYSGYSAPPGASEHQLGLAMDVTLPEYGSRLYVKFGESEEGIWLRDNAYRYGFVIRYLEGKEDITGYNYEPWHIRYLGEDLAKELYERGITLEEYYGNY